MSDISTNMKVSLVLFVAAFSQLVVANAAPSFLNNIFSGIIDKVTGPKASFHIVGGNEAKPHSHPHQVILFNKQRNNNIVSCGGSLISPQWVLTAAHCTEGAMKIVVVLGSHDLRVEELARQAIPAGAWFEHKNWNTKTVTDDIALIKLATLPTLTSNSGAPALRFVQTKLLSNAVCSQWYRRQMPQTMICSDGIEGKGACNGDSGGPMIIMESDGKRTVIGIASFVSREGCESRYPTVFTRVDQYLEWIAKYTGISLRRQ